MSSDATLMMQVLNAVFSGAGSLVEAAFLVCLFLAALYKRHQIHNLGLFRRAIVFFAASLVVQPCLTLLLAYVYMAGGAAANRGNSMNIFLNSGLLMQIISASGPVLFAISIVCAMAALVPRFLPSPEANPPSGESASHR